MDKTGKEIAWRASWICVAANVLLSLFKLMAGLIANSAAMVSDSVHSVSDTFSAFIIIAGIGLSSRSADKDHPYGHERMECVAAIILSAVLFAVGGGIGYSGIKKIVAGGEALAAPGALALTAAIISLVVKEAMYRYVRAAAKKIGSGALMAEAWHHRSDAMSSVGSLVGILGARMGLPVLDPIAGVIICLFIFKVAYGIFVEAIGKMTDKACDDAFIAELRDVILQQDGVAGIDLLKTRLFGEKIYVDLEICADGASPLHITHDIAHNVHDAIEQRFPKVKHCMVHVNPSGDGGENTPQT